MKKERKGNILESEQVPSNREEIRFFAKETQEGRNGVGG